MTHFTKTFLLMGVSVLALSACSGDGKGPGPLGSKNDIVVQNNGLPGAQPQPETTVAANGISSTIENVTPNPAPTVAAGEPVPAPDAAMTAASTAPAATNTMAQNEPLPSADPAVDAAARQIAEQKTPGVTTTATPMNDGTASTTAPTTQTIPADVTPPEPVQQGTVVQTPAPVVDATAPHPTQGPVPSAAPQNTSVYPAEPAVVTPSAAVAAPVPAPAPQLAAASSLNLSDPAVIKSVQAALRLKGIYKGPENGIIDSEFLNSLTMYQAQNKLPIGRVNAETLVHLGIAR